MCVLIDEDEHLYELICNTQTHTVANNIHIIPIHGMVLMDEERRRMRQHANTSYTGRYSPGAPPSSVSWNCVK